MEKSLWTQMGVHLLIRKGTLSMKLRRIVIDSFLFTIQAADTDFSLLLSVNPKNADSLLLGLSREKSVLE